MKGYPDRFEQFMKGETVSMAMAADLNEENMKCLLFLAFKEGQLVELEIRAEALKNTISLT